MAAPQDSYAAAPFLKGFTEGYNTMDTIAALNFGLVISTTLGSFGLREKRDRMRYTILAGVLAGAILGTLGMVDYYGAGVLTVFVFYFFRGRKWWCLLGQVLTLYWINVVLLGGLMYPIRLFGMEFELCQQGLALLALVPIWLYRGRQGCHSKPFQYACYAFYPVHMLLLVLALNFVNR